MDAAGGSVGGDSMALAIAHGEPGTEPGSGRIIVDVAEEWPPPFNVDAAAPAVVALCREYHVPLLVGDNWGGAWVQRTFIRLGMSYYVEPRPKSELYRECLALLNTGRVSLPDQPTLRRQIMGLVRRVASRGREHIDHRPGAHDDVSNAVAGAVCRVAQISGYQRPRVAPDSQHPARGGYLYIGTPPTDFDLY